MNSTLTVADQVREVLATVFGLDLASVPTSTSMSDLAAWDSLYHFTLVAALEDHFGITYTSDEIPTMTSVAAIVRTTATHLR